MKVRLAMLASLALVAAPLAAQGGQGQGMRMGGGMMAAAPSLDTLTAQLALTAEQQPKVGAAIKAYEESTKDAREFMSKAMAGGDMASLRDNPDAMKHMTSLREARTKLATEIKAVLTTEQAAKYDELYPQRMGRRPGSQ